MFNLLENQGSLFVVSWYMFNEGSFDHGIVQLGQKKSVNIQWLTAAFKERGCSITVVRIFMHLNNVYYCILHSKAFF